MGSIGKLSSITYPEKIVEAIGETVIVADVHYNIIWANSEAVKSLEQILPLYDIHHVEDVIGMNMGDFHENPDYQEEIMRNLTETHTSRINIKDTYIADIVISPIYDENIIIGYVVMLMDVTSVIKEERRNKFIIEELSGPILHVWDRTLALPLIGIIDDSRFQIILQKLLSQCSNEDTDYVIIDFSGVKEWNSEFPTQIQQLISTLTLMGIESMVVGIKPILARNLALNLKNVSIYSTTKAAIKKIIEKSEKE